MQAGSLHYGYLLVQASMPRVAAIRTCLGCPSPSNDLYNAMASALLPAARNASAQDRLASVTASLVSGEVGLALLRALADSGVRIDPSASAAERAELFAGAAARFYRLDI